MSVLLDKWVNQDAAKYVAVASKTLGTASGWNIPGGAAVWPISTSGDSSTSQNFLGTGLPSCFTKHMVLDERIMHQCPAPHNDFFYTYTALLLNHKTLDLVNQISESVGYDKMKGLLIVRCGSLEQTILITHIILQILTGSANRAQMASGEYVKIMRRANDPAEVANCYIKLYKDLTKHYQMADAADGYWTKNCGPTTPPGIFAKMFGTDPKPRPRTEADRAHIKNLITKMHTAESKRPKKDWDYWQPNKTLLPTKKEKFGASYFSSGGESGPSRKGLMTSSYPSSHYSEHSRGENEHSRGENEYMIDSEPTDPWYTSNESSEFSIGSFDSRTYLPLHRESALAQSEMTSSGIRERFSQSPSHIHAVSSCHCGRGRNCSCRNRENLDGSATQFDDTYQTTDPRFLYGTAAIHYNVDSDTQDITRTYGTVDQKRHYPRITDFINYGITGSLDS